MIAGGNHTIIQCGLVRNDMLFGGLFLHAEAGRKLPAFQFVKHLENTLRILSSCVTLSATGLHYRKAGSSMKAKRILMSLAGVLFGGGCLGQKILNADTEHGFSLLFYTIP